MQRLMQLKLIISTSKVKERDLEGETEGDGERGKYLTRLRLSKLTFVAARTTSTSS